MEQKNIRRMKKKGELTTAQLVTIIVLIVSFVIILFLLLRLNLGGTTNEEICHNSVVLKSTAGKVVPESIDCKTNYLCISAGGSCQGFSTSETDKVSADSSKIKNETMKAIADSMASCWYEFGEGQINYGSGLLQTHLDAALCSVISFDSTVQEKVPQISYQEFYTFLQNTKKDQSQTYLQYLYGVSSASQLTQFTLDTGVAMDISSDKIITSQKYSVLTGWANNWENTGEHGLKVSIIPTSETSSRIVVPNVEFVTKA